MFHTLAELSNLQSAGVPDAEQLLAALPLAVVVADLAGNIVSRNQAYRTLFDDREPFKLHHVRDLFDESSRGAIPEGVGNAFAAAMDGRDGIVDLVVTCQQSDGLPFWAGATLRLVGLDRPGGAFLVIALRPLGEEIRRTEQLRRSEHRFATLLAHLPVGIIGSESGLRADYANAAGAETFGVGPESLLGLGWMHLIHPDDLERANDAVEEALSERRPAFAPVRIARPDGESRLVHLRVAPVGTGDDLGFVASIEDVTEMRQLADALTHQARHDLLTGLFNRSQVETRLGQLIELAHTTGSRPAVLCVDLDDFKDVNDTFGHLLGDQLLTIAADRIYAAAQPTGVVARFGGDEFVVMFPDVAGAEAASDLAARIVGDLARPFEVEGHELNVTASVGLAWLAADDLVAANATELLRRADLALYQAKRAGKAQAVLASDDVLAAERKRLRLAMALRRAVRDDTLDVHYQPIVSIADERIVGLEALVRWNDPELGRISPDQFIPAAEEAGIVAMLGRNVLRRALGDLATWRKLPGYEKLYVSVNMSMRELDEQAVARSLARALGEADLPASALYVELTESTLLRRESTTVERLDAIRRLGIRLAIDDFGTGYSSLARLRRLPVDLVKIDREFVRDLGADPQASAIVAAIATLAGALGLKTIAEGVETSVQLDELARVAGGMAQGYLYSEPLPPAAVPELLTRRPLRKSEAA